MLTTNITSLGIKVITWKIMTIDKEKRTSFWDSIKFYTISFYKSLCFTDFSSEVNNNIIYFVKLCHTFGFWNDFLLLFLLIKEIRKTMFEINIVLS
jgi:hypothetical protein